ncbi:MAG TPA: recombinase family protein [Vitreimonas sp.]|uniref:recombinase family protein n=1 Tax=Vitreimonas sp. TaxID=3069702 RepID=UPI002D42B8E1|nr:recombinase family protein [Vitreimonas sp.]HYD86273.1 recombinase family protein [Vitreimonas sp.]
MKSSIGACVAYARTSTLEQRAGLEAQIAQLQAAGATKVFFEHVSSVSTVRPKLAEALAYVRERDTFIVTAADRLARNTIDLLNIVDDLTKRGVTVRILSMDLDTSTPTGRLLLSLVASISEAERAWMLERQRHGIAKAKSEGRYKGRAATAQAKAKAKDVRALKASGVGVADIVRQTGISRASVYRILA